MAMGAPIAMNMATARMTTEPYLTLAQWFIAQLSVGGVCLFAWAWKPRLRGSIDDAASFADWLRDVLEHGSGRNDAILLRAAYVSG